MANLTLEDLSRALSVPEVARKLRRDKATVYGWVSSGVRGVRLRSILVGGRRFVMPEAVEEFVAQLSAALDQAAEDDEREDLTEAAEAQLDALLGGGAAHE
ncbi:MAG: helix-turn-helix domain-containing protein [Planctomycetales bacterium]|nr:helix-turn-helix domain-containing protein [Planctomycetales bacterium]